MNYTSSDFMWVRDQNWFLTSDTSMITHVLPVRGSDTLGEIYLKLVP